MHILLAADKKWSQGNQLRSAQPSTPFCVVRSALRTHARSHTQNTHIFDSVADLLHLYNLLHILRHQKYAFLRIIYYHVVLKNANRFFPFLFLHNGANEREKATKWEREKKVTSVIDVLWIYGIEAKRVRERARKERLSGTNLTCVVMIHLYRNLIYDQSLPVYF